MKVWKIYLVYIIIPFMMVKENLTTIFYNIKRFFFYIHRCVTLEITYDVRWEVENTFLSNFILFFYIKVCKEIITLVWLEWLTYFKKNQLHIPKVYRKRCCHNIIYFTNNFFQLTLSPQHIKQMPFKRKSFLIFFFQSYDLCQFKQSKKKFIFLLWKNFLSSEYIKLLLIEMIDKIIRRYPEYQFMYNSLDFLVLCQKNVGHINDIKKM